MRAAVSAVDGPRHQRLVLSFQCSSLILAGLVAGSFVASTGCRTVKPRSIAARPILSLVVSVQDQDGRSPHDLRPADFNVLIDGRPRPIRSVRPAGPFSLLLLLDASASMSGVVTTAELRECVTAVVSQLGPGETLRVATFNSDVEMGPDFGSPLPTILDFLNTVRYHNATHLYDALDTGLSRMERATGRRVLLVVSDGSDTDSRLTGDDVLMRVRRSNTEADAVLPPNKLPTLNGRGPDKALLRIIEETGGMYVQPGNSGDLAAALSNVVRDLQEQYVIEVEVEAFDGKVHHFAVHSRRQHWTFRAARSRILQLPGL